MNKFIRLNISILLILLSTANIFAIEPTWNVTFGSVFDNREGDAAMYHAKTFFFTSLAPEVGLKFTNKDRIAGGAVWNQPLENGIKNGTITPTLYYRHESDKIKFSLGMFPRTQLREPLPGFLWCDSLTYFQKNIKGALVQYNNSNGFIDAYLDWRQMQRKNKREAFNIVFHGEWNPNAKIFLLGSHIMMNHFAKSKNPSPDEHIVDNFLINPYAGINLSSKTPLDSLCIKIGGAMTVERYRANSGWKTPAGVWFDICAEWKFLGFSNSLYSGGKLFPLYGEFGALLYQGESYFRSGFYNRTDVYAKIYRNKFMNLEAQLNFNFTKNNFMFYQRLILDISIGNL